MDYKNYEKSKSQGMRLDEQDPQAVGRKGLIICGLSKVTATLVI